MAMAIREGSGRHISVAPPTVGWREDAVLRLVLKHRKEPYDKYRCGARFEFFQQSDAVTIGQWLARAG
jgi:hypothetical protein